VLFEWDEAKSNRNLRDRQLDFASAALIFDGPVQTAIDDRKAYGEERIISARHANKKEREILQSFVNR